MPTAGSGSGRWSAQRRTIAFPRAWFLSTSGSSKPCSRSRPAACSAFAARYEQHGQRFSIATIDQDATIVESHKKATFPHYQGGRGYQPMLALWAEADLIVADQFRDGNVPAHQEPLTCCQLAFAALPDTITTRYFRGDSGCYESNLLDWLSDPQRQQEPGGGIGFAISARMSPELRRAATLPEVKPTAPCGSGRRAVLRP